MYLTCSPFVEGINYLKCYDNIELNDDEVQESKQTLLKETLRCDRILISLIRISICILCVALLFFILFAVILKKDIMITTLVITTLCVIAHIVLIVLDRKIKNYERRLVLTYKRAKRLYIRFKCYYFDDTELYKDKYYITLEKFLFNNSLAV